MDCNDLTELIERGESTNLEFKEGSSTSSLEDGLKSACAFVNTEGGIVLFGVNDRGDKSVITGNIDELKQKISNKIKNGFIPNITDLVYLDSTTCGASTIIFLRVEKNDTAIYTYKDHVYKRVGSTTVRLTLDEVIRLRKKLESGIKEIAPNIYSKTGPSVKKCQNCGYQSISGFESILSIGAPPSDKKCPECGGKLEIS